MLISGSNFKQIKTTVLGVLIMAAAVAYPFFVEGSNPWIFGIMFLLGMALVFLPDTLFESLNKLLKANSDKKF